MARVGSSADSDLIGRRVLVDPITTYENGFPAEIIGSEQDYLDALDTHREQMDAQEEREGGR